MPECFAVVSGSYSDYQVHVVFESEVDAQAYARQMGRADLKRAHDNIVGGKQGWLVSIGGSAKNPHEGTFETCAWCLKLLSDRSSFGSHPYGVERFDYWPTGTWKASNQDSIPKEDA